MCCAYALAALASGCPFDDDSSSGGSSSNRGTISTSASGGDLLQNLDGWRLAFVSKQPEDPYPRIYRRRPTARTCGQSTTFAATNPEPVTRRSADRLPLEPRCGDEHTPCDHRGRRLQLRQSEQDHWSQGMGAFLVAGGRQAGGGSRIEARYTAQPLRHGRGRIERAANHRSGSRGPICPVVARRRLDRIHLRRRRRLRHLQGSTRRVRLTALTDDGNSGTNNWPIWSPDSKQIGYGRGRRSGELWLMNADGSGKHLVTDVGGVPAAWAPGPFDTWLSG